MRPRLLLRADAGKGTGYGHFVRCCALGAMLRDKLDVSIASFSETGLTPFQEEEARRSGVDILPLRADGLEDFNRAFIEMVEEGDKVVLDNYHFSLEYQQAVARRAKALICIDDMPGAHPDASLLLTSTVLPREAFGLGEEALFFGGPEYALLREPFYAHVGRVYGQGIRKVIVAVGGTDPLGLTSKIVRSIRCAFSQNIGRGDTPEIEVVGGDKDGTFAGVPGVRFHSGVSAAEMCALMDGADLGIFPASTVCLEAFSRGLPVALGYFVENQGATYRHYTTSGWGWALGDLCDSEAALADRMRALFASFGEIEGMVPGLDFLRGRERIREVIGKSE